MKQVKLNKLIMFITVAVCIPLAIMVVGLFFYSASLNNRLSRQPLVNAVDNIQTSIEATLASVKSKTNTLSQTVNFLIFSNSSEDTRVSERARDLISDGKPSLFANTEVVAIGSYNFKCDYNYVSFKYFDSINVEQDILPDIIENTDSGTNSFFYRKNINGHLYLIYVVTSRYGALYVLIDPSRNSAYSNYNALLSGTGKYTLSETEFPHDSSNVIISKYLETCGLYLYLEKEDLFWYQPTQLLLLIFTILFLMLIPISLLVLRHLITRPLEEISKSLNLISSGDLEHRLAIPGTIDDISKFATSINLMLDKIQEYREISFNNQMDAVQAKLQYLQLQIHPHFYLNCMKSLNSYLNLRDYANAQELIVVLSKYMAQAFRDVKNFISLREELECVQNYVKLCNMLSYTIHMEFKLSGSCMQFRCLPMIILTFVENSVKYSTTPDNLKISVQVDVLEDKLTESLLRIVVKNSGSQFPEWIIRENETADVSQFVYRTKHIGISNVRYRLWLIYGELAKLYLRNEDNDAIVEIFIPCEP